METVMEKPKRKAWYQEKIEKLEAELLANKPVTVTLNGESQTVDNYSFAQGVYECMCKYQLLSKEMRKRIRDGIIANGADNFARKKNPWTF